VAVFSVILPTFNSGATVDEAVASVLAQSFSDLELLIVDDCSTDGTRRRLELWAERDGRVHLLGTRSNTGSPAAPRTAALEAATGLYVAFIDHDDVWTPTKLLLQLKKFNSGNFAVVYGNCKVESETGQAESREYFEVFPQQQPVEGNVFPALVRQNFIPMMTSVIRLDWARRVGGFVSFQGVDDWHYWIRTSIAGGLFGYVPEPLGIYRLRRGSLSNTRATPYPLVCAEMFHELGKAYPQVQPVLQKRERAFRRIYNNQRFAAVPWPLRWVLRSAALPPRLWWPSVLFRGFNS